jgi:hypothetical protein
MRLLKIILVAASFAVLPVTTAAAVEPPNEPWKYQLENVSVELSTPLAGGHPDFTTSFRLSETPEGAGYAFTKDLIVTLPPGLIGNPEAFPTCTPAQLGTEPKESECPQESQVGSTDIRISTWGGSVQPLIENEPIYNMTVPDGDTVARFGFFAGIFPVILNARLDPVTHNVIAAVEGASSAAWINSASTTFWGVPSDHVHDLERITPKEAFSGGAPAGGRESHLPPVPFMTNPTSCTEERTVTITTRSYQLPDVPSTVTAPFPKLVGCESLDFKPSTRLELTTSQGTSGTGLDYELNLPAKGLELPNLLSGSHLNRAEVTLPEGLTVNPSEAEGLGVCAPGDFARETYNSAPNEGCPESSKIGTVVATSPVLDLPAEGSLYLAKPYENPFGSLLALYMTLKVPARGVFVGLAGKVSLDPATGQITTVFEDLPQLPVSGFHLHFREGARAPLVSPPACGSYAARSSLTPWAAPGTPLARENSFAIESGPDHGPCPSGGLPPFRPDLLAGTLNNAAGAYSPFYLQLTRSDPEQEITHFSIKLPPGLLAKLAGIPYCSDLAIAQAAARSGPHGGEEELTSPSCPAASQIGTTLVGAGVGQVLTYVPGKVYLAGPYHGAPISIVAITAAKAGPIDLGTVVVREALRVNPETAEAFVDATGSDPIPHIIKGVPVHLRDIRVSVDRPDFTLNPTSCEPTSTASTVLGSGLDFSSEADDNPLTVASRFQAADCAALGFRPKLAISLKGATHRGGTPALKAVLNARPGDANIAGAEVILPHSEFLEQGHIRTVCTRAQFNAGAGNGAQCPAASVYGHARALTPLLSEPLQGPVFLRSNGGERNLPDLLVALHGQQINVDLVGYIDSVREKNRHGEVTSRIRTRFASVPDAPVSRFVLEMQGAKKGLLVNSTNICAGKPRAEANFSAHNGRRRELRPLVRASCAKPHHRRG